MNQESDGATSRWDSVRDWMAFGIAPLAGPLVLAVKFGFSGAPESVVASIFPLALMLAYTGTLLFGLPLYLLLRAFKLTTFWLAPVAGFVIGFAMVFLFFMGIGAKDLEAVPEALQYGGPPGAAVGALLWLIGRPDRQKLSDAATDLSNSDKTAVVSLGSGLLAVICHPDARMLVALLIAPLAVPMIVGLIFGSVVPGTEFSPLLAYPVALIVSVAAFRILRELTLTGLWTAVVAGGVIGLATILCFAILATDPSNVVSSQSGFLVSSIFALSGGIVGALFWLIARPDRQQRSVAPTVEQS